MIKFSSSLFPVTAAILGLAGAASSAHAAVAYWSFQTTAAGGTGTLAVTESSGFAAAPTLVNTPGSGTGTSSDATSGGGVQYNSPVNNTAYTGTSLNMNNTGSGNSMSWATSQTAGSSLTNASFTVTLNTTGLTDLKMQFDIRSATAQNGTPAPGAFSLMQYSYNGTDWFSLGVTSPTWAHLTGSSWARTPLIDLSSADAIENQSSVQLRFTFENSGVAANTDPANMNIRVDNLLITAVPEPASAMLFGGFAVASLLVRRRGR